MKHEDIRILQISSAMIILHNAIRTSCAFVCVRSGSLADVRMHICHQNNGGSNISKCKINKLWREFFPKCAPVSLDEQRILMK